MADDFGGIFRTPEIIFSAAELGLASFGANIPNPALFAALNAAAERCPNLQRIATARVTKVEPGLGNVRLELAEGGHVTAELAVAADGRHSIAPAAAGIALRRWDYPQAAIATSFAHTRAARRHRQRVASAPGTVDDGAAAGTALEPGMGRGTRGGSSA